MRKESKMCVVILMMLVLLIWGRVTNANAADDNLNYSLKDGCLTISGKGL